MTSEHGGGSANRSPDALRILTAVGSPIALATALAFYFGWVRSQAQAVAFGTDVSVFDMSPQDLILRSTNILFFPIILLLLVGLGLVWIEPLIRARGRRVGQVLQFAWLLVPLGLVLLWLIPPVGFNLLPLLVMVAIGGTAYGNLLRRHARGDLSPPRLANVTLVVALLIAALFWQTERFARLGGEALAADVQQNLAARLPAVTLLSTARQHIEGPGVVETALRGSDAGYQYRYEGLYLLQRSGGKYFLLTDGWQERQGRLLIFGDTEAIRLEFGP